MMWLDLYFDKNSNDHQARNKLEGLPDERKAKQSERSVQQSEWRDGISLDIEGIF